MFVNHVTSCGVFDSDPPGALMQVVNTLPCVDMRNVLLWLSLQSATCGYTNQHCHRVYQCIIMCETVNLCIMSTNVMTNVDYI